MKKLFLLLLALSIGLGAYSQKKEKKKSLKSIFKKAENNFMAEKYKEAIPLYSDLLERKAGNANWYFKLGFCYFQTEDEKTQAILYLEKASEHVSANAKSSSFKEKSAPLEAYYYLGRAYHLTYEFDKAIETFERLKKEISPEDINLKAEIEYRIQICENAKELEKHSIKIFLTHLGSAINTDKYSEHSPVISADESVMIFTSKRPDSVGKDTTVTGQHNEDIYISYKKDGRWTEPVHMSSEINTEKHEASIGLSVDGQTLFIYRDDEDRQNGTIYISKLEGEKWTKPVRLPESINTKARETHATLSVDGEQLYFTSDREGGKGGLDIYVVRKLPNGKWSLAENLGDSINTPYDEEGPFIHPDGKTLYFSSKGHNTMGGYDIFTAKMKGDSTWHEPVNIGFPVNTTRDDVFYMPTPDGKRAYYATTQEGNSEPDIWLISLPNQEDTKVAVLTGIVSFCNDNNTDKVYISVEEANTNKLVGIYTPNSLTGKYLIILETEKNYEITYESDEHLTHVESLYVPENYIFKSNASVVSLNVVLLPEVQKKLIARFHKDDPSINFETEENLKALVQQIKAHPDWDIMLEVPHSDSAHVALNTQRIQFIISNLNAKGVGTDKIVLQKESSNLLKINEFMMSAISCNNLPTLDEGSGLVDTEGFNSDTNFDSSENFIIVNNVFFDFNLYQTDEYYNSLNTLSAYLKDNPEAVVEINGFTDSRGNEAYNIKLGFKRAKFAQSYLVKKGVPLNSLVLRSFGENYPIAINENPDKSDNPEARKYNRRVEFRVLKQGKQKLLIQEIKVPIEMKFNNKLRYTVLLSRDKKQIPSSYFEKLGTQTADLKTVRGLNSFLYIIGDFDNKEEANKLLDKLLDLGFSKAKVLSNFELNDLKIK